MLLYPCPSSACTAFRGCLHDRVLRYGFAAILSTALLACCLSTYHLPALLGVCVCMSAQDRVLRYGFGAIPGSDAVFQWRSVHATFYTPMDLRAFPFDRQQLLIQVRWVLDFLHIAGAPTLDLIAFLHLSYLVVPRVCLCSVLAAACLPLRPAAAADPGAEMPPVSLCICRKSTCAAAQQHPLSLVGKS